MAGSDDWRANKRRAAVDHGLQARDWQAAEVHRMRQAALSLLTIVPATFIVTAATNLDLATGLAVAAGVGAAITIAAVCVTLWPRDFVFHDMADALASFASDDGGALTEKSYDEWRAKYLADHYRKNETSFTSMLRGMRFAIVSVGVTAGLLLAAIGLGG